MGIRTNPGSMSICHDEQEAATRYNKSPIRYIPVFNGSVRINSRGSGTNHQATTDIRAAMEMPPI